MLELKLQNYKNVNCDSKVPILFSLVINVENVLQGIGEDAKYNKVLISGYVNTMNVVNFYINLQ